MPPLCSYLDDSRRFEHQAVVPDTDLIVLGAGPGGCSAAIAAAQAGLRVTILERDAFPRDRPGETLHPGLEALFRRLGAWPAVEFSGYVRHPGIQIHRHDESRFEPYGTDLAGPWLGFQAPRADLDARLLGTAIEHGVTVLQPCAAQDVIMHERRVAGICTTRGLIKSRCTIDSSGGRHWLARRIGIRPSRFSLPLVARYGYVSGRCDLRDEAPALNIDAEGWTWTARIGPDKYSWTRLTLGNRRIPEAWLPNEFRGLARCDRTRSSDVTWRRVAAPAGPGYFLVGDAAGVLDPIASNGVLRAIVSGMQAGHLAAQVAFGHCSEEHADAFYINWLSRWFDHDLSRQREFYRDEWPVAFA